MNMLSGEWWPSSPWHSPCNEWNESVKKETLQNNKRRSVCICLSLRANDRQTKKRKMHSHPPHRWSRIFNQMVSGAKWCIYFTQLCDDWWTMTKTIDESRNHVIVIANHNYLRSTCATLCRSSRLAVTFICWKFIFYESFAVDHIQSSFSHSISDLRFE